jgi:hypothetical protein
MECRRATRGRAPCRSCAGPRTHRARTRPWLFAFAGARRPGDEGEVGGGVHREIEAWMDILAGVGANFGPLFFAGGPANWF